MQGSLPVLSGYHKLPPAPTQAVFRPLSLWEPTDIKRNDTRFDNQLIGS